MNSGAQISISVVFVTNLQYQIEERVKIADKATESEAKAGTNNTKWMTPLTVKKAIEENSRILVGVDGTKYKIDFNNSALYPQAYLEVPGTTATNSAYFPRFDKSMCFDGFNLGYGLSALVTYDLNGNCTALDIPSSIGSSAGNYIVFPNSNDSKSFFIISNTGSASLTKYTPTISNPLANPQVIHSGRAMAGVITNYIVCDVVMDKDNIYVVSVNSNRVIVDIFALNGSSFNSYTFTYTTTGLKGVKAHIDGGELLIFFVVNATSGTGVLPHSLYFNISSRTFGQATMLTGYNDTGVTTMLKTEYGIYSTSSNATSVIYYDYATRSATALCNANYSNFTLVDLYNGTVYIKRYTSSPATVTTFIATKNVVSEVGGTSPFVSTSSEAQNWTLSGYNGSIIKCYSPQGSAQNQSYAYMADINGNTRRLRDFESSIIGSSTNTTSTVMNVVSDNGWLAVSLITTNSGTSAIKYIAVYDLNARYAMIKKEV